MSNGPLSAVRQHYYRQRRQQLAEIRALEVEDQVEQEDEDDGQGPLVQLGRGFAGRVTRSSGGRGSSLNADNLPLGNWGIVADRR